MVGRIESNLKEAEGVSVVIPTYGRQRMLGGLLKSLQEARAQFSKPAEVIVIDSTEESRSDTVRELCVQHDACLLRAANNVSHKRNVGIAHARYSVVLFVDSDCNADKDILSAHWQAHQALATDQVGVLGVTKWSGDNTIGSRIVDHAPALGAAFSFATWLSKAPWGTCTNLSIRRSALLEIDGFDETMPKPLGGEDVDLGLRLTAKGYRIGCRKDIVVMHDRDSLPSLGAVLKKAARSGRSEVYLAERHSERVRLEFPQFLIVVLMLGLVALVCSLFSGISAWAWPVIFSIWFFGARILLGPWPRGVRGQGAFGADWAARFGAIAAEVAFDFGKIVMAIRARRFSRIWTKFVYLDDQLLAERDRRVVQVWVLLTGLVLAVGVAG